ncbi:hypothetical protein DFA_09523 [Cavenderia fasciculata]|uniref:Uncharacterized protein n=1 Tax=Cavenderia fasciculata TaxID=261658 RepID=F4Q7V4_CACFS|nr:uncharacterized protein DFA_09523 [Cavenderia fasciculata]EGG15854.1 hypothetical protein DFA_09523 [Cavenderia fasciculata]|eukprot:XP_004352179.1 hypothetical protein DFA_09523 [Cavenderia fasciculata]
MTLQIVRDYHEINPDSTSWMFALAFDHIRALVYTFQSKPAEALQVIRASETIKPTTQGLELITQQAILAFAYYTQGGPLRALDEIASMTPLIGERLGCGIRVAYSLAIITKILLSIVEHEKSSKKAPLYNPLNYDYSRDEILYNHFLVYNNLNPISSTDIPKLFLIKDIVSCDIQETSVGAGDNPNPLANSSNSVGGGGNPAASAAAAINTSNPQIQVNGVQIPLDPNYSSGQGQNQNLSPPSLIRSNSTVSNHSNQTNASQKSTAPKQQLRKRINYELNLEEIETWIKRLLVGIKSMEKGAPFATLTYYRLSGLYNLIYPSSSSSHQKGLSLLYKSAKESKQQGMPFEEAQAWHEISRFEEPTKQQAAWQTATDIYHSLDIDPFILINNKSIN